MVGHCGGVGRAGYMEVSRPTDHGKKSDTLRQFVTISGTCLGRMALRREQQEPWWKNQPTGNPAIADVLEKKK
jgi:hypothetical protein